MPNMGIISAKPRIVSPGGFGGVNKCRDGSLSSMSLLTPAMGWEVNGVGYLYDGDRAGTWAARTGSVGNHAGLGVQTNFSVSLSIKVIYISGYVGYFSNCTYMVQYYNGSWVTCWSGLGSDYAALGGFFFNLNGDISASSWRWYMSAYSYTPSNFYINEEEAYTKVIYK